jgi:lysophospholipase L1-like esterase
MRNWLGIAACVAALSGCTARNADTKSTLPPSARYVAMGSSYAAGSGLGSIKPDTPPRCQRSALNYATLLAARLHLELTDASCGGATTAHILGPWGELPPQIDALTADTRLVTITIGGNDVGFVMNLMIASCVSTAQNGRPCPSMRQVTEADWAKLEDNFRQIARQVRTRAPAARLVFVDYVSILPTQGTCPAIPLSPANADILRAAAQRLSDINSKVAREEGAEIFQAGALSRSHTACDAAPWSVGAPGSAPGAPWHPNAAGMKAIADGLAAKLGG